MTAILLRALVIAIACLACIALFVFVWPKWSAEFVVPAAAVSGVVVFLTTAVPLPIGGRPG